MLYQKKLITLMMPGMIRTARVLFALLASFGPSLLPTPKTMTYKNLAEPGPIDTRRELSVRSEEAARSRHAGQREMEGPER